MEPWSPGLGRSQSPRAQDYLVPMVIETRRALEEILAFLRDGILPHAAAEEKALYPEIDGLLRAAGGATATMSMDHQEIGRLVEELATAQARAGGVDREGARRLLYSLEAILSLHFSKETDVYLPLHHGARAGRQVSAFPRPDLRLRRRPGEY